LKDYVGSDYRYFDIARLASGLYQLNSSSSRSIIGPDRQHLPDYHNFEGATFKLNSGWNLASLPITRSNHSPDPSFYIHCGSAYAYTGTYHRVDSLQYGAGYWIKTSASAGVASKARRLELTCTSIKDES